MKPPRKSEAAREGARARLRLGNCQEEPAPTHGERPWNRPY